MANNSTSLMARMAETLQVDAKQLQETIKKMCFGGQNASQEEFMTLLMTAERFDLNPLLGQIWAFKSQSGLVKPLVSVDGWTQIMNRQSNFDGYEIRYSDSLIKVDNIGTVPEWCECTIYLKDRSRPVTERVYIAEKAVTTSPVWRKSPRLMLHHRALIQAIRFAFSISGVADENDELLMQAEPGDVVAHRPTINPVTVAQAEIIKPQAAAPAIGLLTDGTLQSLVDKLALRGRKSNDWAWSENYIKQKINPVQQEQAFALLAEKRSAARRPTSSHQAVAQTEVQDVESDESNQMPPPPPAAPDEIGSDLPF